MPETQEFEQINRSYVISFICFLSHVWCTEAKRLQLEEWIRGVELSFRLELMVNLEH